MKYTLIFEQLPSGLVAVTGDPDIRVVMSWGEDPSFIPNSAQCYLVTALTAITKLGCDAKEEAKSHAH